MAKTARVTLFEREIRERLSQPAVELLFERAQVLSEGERVRGIQGGETFYGSTMLTIDLAAATSWVRESCDEEAAHRVAALMASDARVARCLRQIIDREVCRLVGRMLEKLHTDVRLRTEGTRIYVDVDFEGALPAAPRLAP
ncbi:MAG TPA: hypothetical protein VH877_32060 [Polyangia bacterium]|jgi:hypothetical protein|nr:hypothetical protein [Polyangia bacterium]